MLTGPVILTIDTQLLEMYFLIAGAISRQNKKQAIVALSTSLVKDDSVSKDVNPLSYQSMVGSLLYAALPT